MNKKLPNMFVNKIDKNLSNNDTVYYSSNRQTLEKVVKSPSDYMTINQKINAIFKSLNHAYKLNVKIVYKDGTESEKILIGKKQNNLITYDNEIINISDILNIEKK